MTTFLNFQDSLFADESISSPADSPASHSVPQGSEKGETMSDISSPKCFELFERFSPAGSSLKTFAACLVSNLDRYSPRLSHHWKAKASKSLHFVFLLVPSKPRTDETDCGLLHTPKAANYSSETPETFRARMNRNTKPNDRTEGFAHLAQQIEYSTPLMLGTPTNRNVERSPETMEKSKNFRKSQGDWNTVPLYLAEQIAMLPTPTTNDVSGGANKVKIEDGQFKRDAGTVDHSANLQSVLAMLPTPATRDYKGTNSAEHLAKDRGHHDQLPNALQMNTGMKLQPAFVEWMMGYPIGYTDLKPSETA